MTRVISQKKAEIEATMKERTLIFNERSLSNREMPITNARDFVADCIKLLQIKHGMTIRLTLEVIDKER